MNKTISKLLLCLLLLCCSTHAIAQTQATPNQVAIRFTAVNKDGDFVASIIKDDIRVLQGGVTQSIIELERQSDGAVSLALLIDMSASQEKVFPTVKATSFSFVNSVLRSGKDTAAVITFTGKLNFEQVLTSELNKAQLAVQRLQFTPLPKDNLIFAGKPPDLSDDQILLRSTAIWDAVSLTCEQTLQQSPPEAKRAIILLSDGVDTSSKQKLSEAVDRAIKTKVTVYAIGIGDDTNYDGVYKDGLRKLTERTGGKAFFPKKVVDLQTAVKQIEQELRTYYVVTYSPSNAKAGDPYRKLEIELANPEKKKEKIKLAHQHGYFVETR